MTQVAPNVTFIQTNSNRLANRRLSFVVKEKMCIKCSSARRDAAGPYGRRHKELLATERNEEFLQQMAAEGRRGGGGPPQSADLNFSEECVGLQGESDTTRRVLQRRLERPPLTPPLENCENVNRADAFLKETFILLTQSVSYQN